MSAERHRGIVGLLVRALEWVVVLLFAALTLDVLWGVFSRYVLGLQSRWTEEVAIYVLVWVSLLGAALVYRDRGHLGVDYFVGRLPKNVERLVAIFAEFTVLVFAAFALCYGGLRLVQQNLEADQVTPALGVKVGLLYMAAPLCGLFFVIFAIEHLLRLFRRQDIPAGGKEAAR